MLSVKGRSLAFNRLASLEYFTKEVLLATLHPCVKSAPDTEMQASGSHAEPLAARWVRKREIKDSTPQADMLPAVMDEMVLQRQRLANQGVEGNPFRNP